METSHELNPPPVENTPVLLSKSELAEELHKSCRTIEIWVKAGYKVHASVRPGCRADAQSRKRSTAGP